MLAVAGLGGLVFGLLEWPRRGADVVVIGTIVLGAVALVLLVIVERRVSNPMLPLTLFRSPGRAGGPSSPPAAVAGSPPGTTRRRTPVAVAYSAASRANRPRPLAAAARPPAAGAFSVAFLSIDSILETLMTSTSRARAQAASAAGGP